MSTPFIRTRDAGQNFVRVNFSNRGLSKVIKDPTSLRADVPDRSSIVRLSDTLSDLKIEKDPPLGFPSIPEFIGIDYVGYVVEKERLDPRTGKWFRIDEYKIIGSRANSFKDSRVAYGHQYRYRIKSIIKVTTSVTKEGQEKFDLIENVKRFEKNRIKDRLGSLASVLAEVDRVTNQGLSTKLSTGRPIETFDVIEGLRMEVTSRNTSAVRVPISSTGGGAENLRRLKGLRVKDLDFMRGSISQERLQGEINRSLEGFKESITEYKSFYYESAPSKSWVYVNVAEKVPPPPPTAIKITPNSLLKEVRIAWLKPANPQRDIQHFRVYKRMKVGDPWRKSKKLNETENIFIDGDIEFGEKWIYALTCIDAHGIESFLSTQIQAELNSNFAAEKKEKLLKWISGSGTKPSETNVVLKKFLDREEPIIAYKNISLAPSHDFSDTSKSLLIRVTSLDTHETKEFKVRLDNVNTRDIYREE